LDSDLAAVNDTLASLIQLLDSVPHLPLLDHVADAVLRASDAFALAQQLQREGRFGEALALASAARVASRSGFLDPSMLAQVSERFN
jgi:hypothetical protein